jgi:hypothetical protein
MLFELMTILASVESGDSCTLGRDYTLMYDLGIKFDSNLTQCVGYIWTTLWVVDGWACFIEVHASR